MKALFSAGNKIGRFTIIGKVRGSKPAKYTCRCQCGTVVDVLTNSLTSGKSRSCGCLHIDTVTKHGGYNTGAYTSWQCMRDRCSNPNFRHYDRYGGRGISVCKRWEKFANFLIDMGPRPYGCTIERIDSNGNYTKANCRWATKREQSNNTSRNRNYTYRGESHTLTEWCRALSLHYDRIRSRLKLGWTFLRAVTTPITEHGARAEMVGARFGKLVVLEYADTVDKRARWKCRCDCGRIYIGVGKFMRQGRVVSCGCKRGRVANNGHLCSHSEKK